MKPSLKNALRGAIKCYNGNVYPYSRMEELCRLCGRRITNGERRLRELASEENTEIEKIKHKGCVIGYRLKKIEKNGQICLV